jgi:hypothetical protein
MPEKVKIQFRLNPEDEQGYEVENLWAEPLEDHTFRILNSPFFVFELSCGDVVKAVPSDSKLQYVSIVRRGGHSTYRLFLQGDHTINDPSFQEYWRSISAEGATLENANDRFVAVDVPPKWIFPRFIICSKKERMREFGPSKKGTIVDNQIRTKRCFFRR